MKRTLIMESDVDTAMIKAAPTHRQEMVALEKKATIEGMRAHINQRYPSAQIEYVRSKLLGVKKKRDCCTGRFYWVHSTRIEIQFICKVGAGV